uniref:15-hydroxyprostaglandin dehydrogenase n=1 Tax=Astyanax mexicanus TaxID=7994 RepID=A0A8B9HPI8_ASTMX
LKWVKLTQNITGGLIGTVEQFGRLDIVINNAGINNEKNWEKTIEVNLVGTDIYSVLGLETQRSFYKARNILPHIYVVCYFVSSSLKPLLTTVVHFSVYSKAFPDASEQCDYGVRINALCPAFVDTQLLQTVENEETMGKFVKFKDEFKQRMDKYGVLKPSLIAEGMMRIITDETLNGAVMKITCSKGIHFHTYEPLSA